MVSRNGSRKGSLGCFANSRKLVRVLIRENVRMRGRRFPRKQLEYQNEPETRFIAQQMKLLPLEAVAEVLIEYANFWTESRDLTSQSTLGELSAALPTVRDAISRLRSAYTHHPDGKRLIEKYHEIDARMEGLESECQELVNARILPLIEECHNIGQQLVEDTEKFSKVRDSIVARQAEMEALDERAIAGHERLQTAAVNMEARLNRRVRRLDLSLHSRAKSLSKMITGCQEEIQRNAALHRTSYFQLQTHDDWSLIARKLLAVFGIQVVNLAVHVGLVLLRLATFVTRPANVLNMTLILGVLLILELFSPLLIEERPESLLLWTRDQFCNARLDLQFDRLRLASKTLVS